MEPELPVVSFVTEKKAKTKKTPSPAKKSKPVATKKRKTRSSSDESAEDVVQSPSAKKKKVMEQQIAVEDDIETMQAGSDDSSDDESESDNDNAEQVAPKKPKAKATFGDLVERLLATTSSTSDQPQVLSALPPALRQARESPNKAKAKDPAAREAAKKEREFKIQKHLLRNKDHVAPELADDELELKLRKFATKGVVKLFNALKQHSKQFKNANNPYHLPSEKTEKLSKGKFFEILQQNRELTGDEVQRMLGNKKGEAPTPTALLKPKKEPKQASGLSKFAKASSEPQASNEKSQWDVLKDDYLLGARMKDWNKDSEDEAELEGEQEGEMEGSDSE